MVTKQVKKIKEIKDNYDLCIVLSWAAARVAYLSGINFVNKIALLAEKMDHHPDIKIGWCKVDILLTTHDSGDVTKKDIELASLCDKIKV